MFVIALYHQDVNFSTNETLMSDLFAKHGFFIPTKVHRVLFAFNVGHSVDHHSESSSEISILPSTRITMESFKQKIGIQGLVHYPHGAF